jgi:hypothetical protein
LGGDAAHSFRRVIDVLHGEDKCLAG